MNISLYTLGFNLVSEITKATERLYQQNERNFAHYILDLGFPLINGNEIPESIDEVQEQNSESLKALANRFGSKYLKFENEGVSQNTNKIYQYVKPNDEDVLISCEPDEVQLQDGWVNAMSNVLAAGLAYCAPRLEEHKEILAGSPYAKLSTIGGEQVYIMTANLNYGQIGYSGSFLNKFNGIRILKNAPIYGYIEAALMQMTSECGMRWGILRDYVTEHTDYEKQTPGASKLLREWKNDSIFYLHKTDGRQIQFSDWLLKKKNGEL